MMVDEGLIGPPSASIFTLRAITSATFITSLARIDRPQRITTIFPVCTAYLLDGLLFLSFAARLRPIAIRFPIVEVEDKILEFYTLRISQVLTTGGAGRSRVALDIDVFRLGSVIDGIEVRDLVDFDSHRALVLKLEFDVFTYITSRGHRTPSHEHAGGNENTHYL